MENRLLNNRIISIYIYLSIYFIIVFMFQTFNGYIDFSINLFYAHFKDNMADFYNSVLITQDKDPYGLKSSYVGFYSRNIDVGNGIYPPFAYMIFRTFLPFLQHSKNAMIFSAYYFMFLINNLFILTIFNKMKIKKIYKYLLILTLFFSGVFIFAFERGNIVILSAYFILYFVFYNNDKNKILRELSLIALAMAISLKITPALIGIILLYDKRWIDIIKLAIYTLIIFFLPFLFWEQGILPNFLKMIQNIHNFAVAQNLQFSENILNNIFPTMSIFSIILAFFQPDQWKKLLLIICSTYFSGGTSNYSSLYFIPILCLFLEQANYSIKNILYAVIFALLFSPLYFGFNLYSNYNIFIAKMLFIYSFSDTVFSNVVNIYYNLTNRANSAHVTL